MKKLYDAVSTESNLKMESGLNLTLDTQEDEIEPKESVHETFEKVIRKSHMVYYPDSENISMPHGQVPQNSGRVTNTPNLSSGSAKWSGCVKEKPSYDIPPVGSGESLHKTFEFKQYQNDEEVDKCIRFWRSIVEKNLEPVKCTIIENMKSKQNDELHISNTENNVAENSVDKKPIEKKQLIKNFWLSTLEDLQRRKLDQVKLTAKNKCRLCDTVSSSTNKDRDEFTKMENKGNLEQLNGNVDTLESSSTNLLGSIPSSDVHETLPTKHITKTESSKPDLEKIKEESSKYQLIDAIQEKKKSGEYALWNKLKKPNCQCTGPNCNCNTNAILSFEENKAANASSLKTNQRKVSLGLKKQNGECLCGEANCDCTKTDTGSLSNPGIGQNKRTSLVSFGKCCCGEANCDCNKTSPVSGNSKGRLSVLDLNRNKSTSSVTGRKTKQNGKCHCGEANCDCNKKSLVGGNGKANASSPGVNQRKVSLLSELEKQNDECLCGEASCNCNKIRPLEKKTEANASSPEANQRKVSLLSGLEKQNGKCLCGETSCDCNKPCPLGGNTNDNLSTSDLLQNKSLVTGLKTKQNGQCHCGEANCNCNKTVVENTKGNVSNPGISQNNRTSLVSFGKCCGEINCDCNDTSHVAGNSKGRLSILDLNRNKSTSSVLGRKTKLHGECHCGEANCDCSSIGGNRKNSLSNPDINQNKRTSLASMLETKQNRACNCGEANCDCKRAPSVGGNKKELSSPDLTHNKWTNWKTKQNGKCHCSEANCDCNKTPTHVGDNRTSIC